MTSIEHVLLLATGSTTGQPDGVTSPLFSTADVQAFLDLEGGDIRLAAALTMETMANSASRVARIVNSGQFQDSTTAIPVQLREGAKRLREQVYDAPASCEVNENPYHEVWE